LVVDEVVVDETVVGETVVDEVVVDEVVVVEVVVNGIGDDFWEYVEAVVGKCLLIFSPNKANFFQKTSFPFFLNEQIN
jgi:hypothetical protein